jgi:fatty acid desaturase
MTISIREIKKSTKCPDVAYPTLGLFGLCFGSYVCVLLLNSTLVFPNFTSFDFSVDKSWMYWIGSTLFGIVSFIVEVIICYSSFTVAHDCIHRSTIKKYPFWNDMVGFISQLLLGPTSNWWILRWAHLTHHSKTNDDVFDPDHWASFHGPGGRWLTPLRWFCIDTSYFLNYFKHGFLNRRFQTKCITIGYQLFVFYGLYLSWNFGGFLFLFQHWILPSRCALFILRILFDFIPHYPHDVKRDDNKLKTTSYLYVPYILRPFASFLMFEQIYHSAHHVNPTTPFYQYKEVWEKAKKELIQEGIPIKQVVPEVIARKMSQLIEDEEYYLINKKDE